MSSRIMSKYRDLLNAFTGARRPAAILAVTGVVSLAGVLSLQDARAQPRVQPAPCVPSNCGCKTRSNQIASLQEAIRSKENALAQLQGEVQALQDSINKDNQAVQDILNTATTANQWFQSAGYSISYVMDVVTVWYAFDVLKCAAVQGVPQCVRSAELSGAAQGTTLRAGTTKISTGAIQLMGVVAGKSVALKSWPIIGPLVSAWRGGTNREAIERYQDHMRWLDAQSATPRQQMRIVAAELTSSRNQLSALPPCNPQETCGCAR